MQPITMPTLDDSRDRAELYRLWRAGHDAGLTHPRSLEMMGERDARAVEATRQWLLRGTAAGRDVSQLVRTGPQHFDEFERTLLPLGDESGRLDETFRLLEQFFAGRHRLSLKVRSRLAYPFFTALAACFVAPLPLLIRGYTRTYFILALGSAVLLLLVSTSVLQVMHARYGRRPPFARARMARALATAVEAGLPLPRALRLAGAASAHPQISGYIAGLDERRLATSSIRAVLAGCPLLTPDFIATVATAEATGDLSILTRLADLYEDGLR